MANQRLIIPGPAGAIEAVLADPDSGPVAVLCHPHPAYGGSMHDSVLDTLAGALAPSGIGTLRFNFRGVGGSEGRHDGGTGEIDDLKAVLAWLEASHPGRPRLLGGYSFGAGIVSRLLAEPDTAGIERALLVAPPVGSLPAAAPDGRIPVDVFTGDADAFVDLDALSAWTHARVHVIPGADHFFGGAWEDLAEAVAGILRPAE